MKEVKELTHIECPHCGGSIDLGAPIKKIIEGVSAMIPEKVRKRKTKP